MEASEALAVVSTATKLFI